MNKIINIFTLVLLAIFGFTAVGSVYDLGFSVYEVNDIPYIKEVSYGLTLVVLLLGVVRIKRRLEGKKDIKSYQNFTYTTSISKTARTNSILFLSIEMVFGIAIIIILNKITEWDDQMLILPMILVLAVLVIENLIYLITFISQKERFKLGVGKQFIAYFDREMHLYYYKGLTRIEIYQNMVNFRFKKDLNLFLHLDIIPANERKAFFVALENAVKDQAIFYDDSYHQYIKSLPAGK